MVLEVLDTAEVLKATFTVDPTPPATITSAELIAALGAETDFILRAYAQFGGLNSLNHNQVKVWKT